MDTTERTEITISIDMAADLAYAGMDVERDGIDVDDMVARWTEAAERIGAEMGYEVVVVERQEQAQTRTADPRTEGEGDTIERVIWQAAHDVTSAHS